MSAPEPKPNPPSLDERAIASLIAAAVVWAVCGLGFAALTRRQIAPAAVPSYALEHGLAFYLVAVLTAAGLRRMSIRGIALGLAAAALALWALRLSIPAARAGGWTDLFWDLGGAAAGLLPLALGRRQGPPAR